MLKPTPLRVIAVLAFVGALLLLATWQSGLTGQICEKGAEQHNEHCATYNLAFVILIKIREIVDDNDGLITALATIVIAAFTCTLWISTRNLWLAGEEQIAVARESAEAATLGAQAAREAAQESIRQNRLSFPAKVVLNFIELTWADGTVMKELRPGARFEGFVQIGNKGRETAEIQAAYVVTYWTGDVLPMHHPIFDAPFHAGMPQGTKVDPGGFENIEIDGVVPDGIEGKYLYVLGIIAYKDQVTRNLGCWFARRYNPKTGRFEVTGDAQYEHYSQ